MAVTPLALDADFRVGQVAYNGFLFPPALHSSAKFSPVMDNSDRIVKYMKVDIEIECYIFLGATYSGPSSPNTDIPYFPSTASGSIPAVHNTAFTTDADMSTVRKLLSEPGGELRFTYQGAGNLTLNAPQGPSDVSNGPKPKIVNWIPMTNKMAKITWQVTACFSPCADTIYGITPSDIAQFPYSMTFDIGDDGLTTRTTTGVLEQARMTRTTASGDIVTSFFDTLDMEKRITDAFPMMKQFKRKQSYTISEDRTTLSFTIIDREIGSDEAYGVGCIDEEVSLRASASLETGGFHQWRVQLSGSITVAPGFTKYFAYAEIARLFQQIYVKNGVRGRYGHITDHTERDANGNYIENSNPSRTILQSISYGDDLFGRSVDFDIAWSLFTNPLDIFLATGMFKPIREDMSKQNEAWGKWVTSLSQYTDNGGFQRMGINQADDIIVSLCQPMRQGSFNKPEPPNPIDVVSSKKKPIKDEEVQLPQSLYNNVCCSFAIEADNHTISHKPLGLWEPYNPKTNASLPTLTELNMDWFKQGQSGDTQQSERIINHKLRQTSYILIFSGFMERLCYAPPIPEVHKCYGQDVYKIGTDLIKQIPLGIGIDVETGKNYSRHGLVWQQKYALQLPPTSSKIDSDGHPELYGVSPNYY